QHGLLAERNWRAALYRNSGVWDDRRATLVRGIEKQHPPQQPIPRSSTRPLRRQPGIRLQQEHFAHVLL
ncbi:hypothetical protein CDAR_448341, partial [Caerostris darwini]